ncbi:MAG: lytic murein transglycosylase, partial [Burkholderiales bacterium]
MRNHFSAIVAACMLLALPSVAAAAAPQKVLAPEVQAFVQEMVERHGFEQASLERTLRGARFVNSIITAMDAPSTSLPWHEFRARHVTEARISNGLKFWAE